MTLGSLTNLFWLLPPIQRATLAVIRVASSARAGQLGPMFASVQHHVVEASWLEAGKAFAEAGERGPVTCLSVDLEPNGPISQRGRPEALRLAKRCLLPGRGVLVVYLSSHRNLAPGLHRHRLQQELAEIGFQDVRGYYLVPAAENPRDIVPIDAAAVMAWDTLVSRPFPLRVLRQLIIRLGLHDRLFGHVLVVAIA